MSRGQQFGQRRGGVPSYKHFILKKRERETHDVAIHGGTKVGGHRRRVTRWSPWRAFRWLRDERDAIVHLEHATKLHPLSEIACFYDGKRVTMEQLRHRVAERERVDAEVAAIERATPEPDGSCKSCATRRRAGLDGQCPACWNAAHGGK